MNFDKNKTLFIDIETTGLTPDISAITVIGCIDFEGKITQWFNKDGFSQEKILVDFLNFIKNYTTLITFNGTTFDLPFLKYKIKEYHLEKSLDAFLHYDLYRILRPYRHLFPMTSFRQAALEQYLEIQRQDHLSGKQLIKRYQSYLESGSTEEKEAILLHNREDLSGLLAISSLLCYPALLEGSFFIKEPMLIDDVLQISFSFKKKFPKKAYFHRDQLKLTISGYDGILICPLEHGILKHYHPNPKDYFYLPREDIVIPKSMGTFVEKNCRLPADSSHCYSKFQPGENFLSDTEALYTFCKDTIYYLLRKD